MNSSSPRIQLCLRAVRHRLALKQSTPNTETIAKSTFQALRFYYAATKSDKDAYSVCKETVSPILEQIVSTNEGAKIVNFMAVMSRKAGLFIEAMKWDDLGLRTSGEGEKASNALFILRNAGILFCLNKEEIGIQLFNQSHT